MRSLTAIAICAVWSTALACSSKDDGDDGLLPSGAGPGSGASSSGGANGTGANGTGANGTGANGTGANGTGSTGNGGTGIVGNTGSGGGIVVTFGGAGGMKTGTGTGGFDPGEACVGESVEGELVPADLYFMVDITGSMNCPVPDSKASPCEVDPGAPYSDTTRWVVESAALKSFLSAPANAGLGVGIGFFPGGSDICNSSNYTRPAVEIAPLPGAAAALSTAIDMQKPAGNTPTVASLTGAIQHAQTWANAHPGTSTAVVYATDGYPKSCGSDNTIANAAGVAKAAYDGKPSIRTYVLGVGQNLSGLNQIAVAGGTDQAYLIDTTQNASAQLTAALENIRARSIAPCTYTIPEPPAGQQIDYEKVNVRFTSGTGEVTNAERDPSLTACNDGWQYSADKTTLNLCGAFCEAVKADAQGSLNVLFGCATQVAPPH